MREYRDYIGVISPPAQNPNSLLPPPLTEIVRKVASQHRGRPGLPTDSPKLRLHLICWSYLDE